MKYTAKQFRRDMPEWKRKKDSIVARFIHRPLSYYFSSVFYELGLTPNQVSVISIFIAIGCCTSFLFNDVIWLYVGAILMNLWSITDSADGNMARSFGGQEYGGLIDAASSYLLIAFLFPCIGFAIYRSGGLLFQPGDAVVILMGAAASASDTLTRLLFQKYHSSEMEIKIKNGQEVNFDGGNFTGLRKIQGTIDAEFGLGGWNMLAIFACVAANCLDVYIVFYFFYYGLTLIATLAYLIVKTRCLSSNWIR